MHDDELRSRLHAAIADPPPGSTHRLVEAARARSMGGRRPQFAAVFAVGLAVLALVLGGGGLVASLRASRVPVPVGPLPTASPVPSPPAQSPVPSPSPSTLPTPPAGQAQVVLPTSAQVIPAGGNTVWVSIAGAAGQLVFRSQDQGKTWELRTASPGQLSFVGATHGWSLSPGVASGECGAEDVSMATTVDGAASWQTLSTSGIASDQCKQNLGFVSPTTGFLTAYGAGKQPVVYRSRDGGHSWSASQPVPDPPGQRTAPADYLTLGAVSAEGSDLLVSAWGWQHTYVYRSRDAGVTWSLLATVPGADGGTMVSFLDATHWWLSGPGYGPGDQYTADAGAHVGPAPGHPDSAAPVSPVFTFSDLNVGYATVRGSIWRTVNGGAHWALLQTPGT